MSTVDGAGDTGTGVVTSGRSAAGSATPAAGGVAAAGGGVAGAAGAAGAGVTAGPGKGVPALLTSRPRYSTVPTTPSTAPNNKVNSHFIAFSPDQSCRITGKPGLTTSATLAASQLVRRIQPCDSVLPMLPGSGVPWMP